GENLVAAALRNPLIVVRGVQCAGRKLEAALTFDSAVTDGAVASVPGQDGGDLAAETDRLRRAGIFDLQRRAGLLSRKAGGQEEIAIGQRCNAAVREELRERRLREMPFCLGRDIALLTVVERRDGQELLAGARAAQARGSRHGPQGNQPVRG